MENQEIKTDYLKPKIKVVEIKTRRLVCASANGSIDASMSYDGEEITWTTDY